MFNAECRTFFNEIQGGQLNQRAKKRNFFARFLLGINCEY